MEGGSLLSTVQKVLFPQLKRGLPAPNLAVRQEHLALMRTLVLAFPEQYAELAPLTGVCSLFREGCPASVALTPVPIGTYLSPLCVTLCCADADAEVDMLLNVAHIQLHRRARWVCRQ